MNERLIDNIITLKKVKKVSRYSSKYFLNRIDVTKLKNKLIKDIKKVIYPREDVEIIHTETEDTYISIKATILHNEIPRHYYDKETRTNDIYIEVLILDLCRILLKEEVCPHLPFSYGSYICYSKDIFNVPTSSDKCLLILSEYANLGDLKSFLKNYYKRVTYVVKEYEVIASILFQIYVGLYSLQKYFNITHHDLHVGNVLINEINCDWEGMINNKCEYIEYNIDGYKYYMPNLGFNVTLWDFGYATIPNKLMRSDMYNYYNNLKSILDYKNLYKNKKIEPDYIQIPRLTVDYSRITRNIKERVLEDPLGIFEIVEKYFQAGKGIDEVIYLFKDIYKYKDFKSNIKSKYSLDKKLKSKRYKEFHINKNDKSLILNEKSNIKKDTEERMNYIINNELISKEIKYYEME